MRIRRVYASIWPSLLRARAFVLYPFILFKYPAAEIARNPSEARRLFRHEWQHVIQVRRVGWFRFYASYLWQQVTVGYRENKWEVEARERQYDPMPDECQKAFARDFPTLR